MAKKRKATGGVTMAAALRKVLTDSPTLSGREAKEAVQELCPGMPINENSFSVAYSVTRRKLGITQRRGRKSQRAFTPVVGRVTPPPSKTVDLELLQAARGLLKAAGDVDTAVAAVKQLQALQIKS